VSGSLKFLNKDCNYLHNRTSYSISVKNFPAACYLLASGSFRRSRCRCGLPIPLPASAVVAALILVAFALFVSQRQWRKRATAAAGARTQPAPALRRLSYQQLRRATGSFEAGSKLGQGGFGLVYSLIVYSVQPEA
jgi:hypothetical protein